jgi:hypothetical protein
VNITFFWYRDELETKIMEYGAAEFMGKVYPDIY